MIYSCFVPERGTYDYYENSLQMQLNADLPVPRLPPDAGKIGVPAIDAGRPLPSDARKTGEGWHARGMVVNCRGRSGMSAFGELPNAPTWVWPVVGVGLLAVLWKCTR
jgi:hypothetical protein